MSSTLHIHSSGVEFLGESHGEQALRGGVGFFRKGNQAERLFQRPRVTGGAIGLDQRHGHARLRRDNPGQTIGKAQEVPLRRRENPAIQRIEHRAGQQIDQQLAGGFQRAGPDVGRQSGMDGGGG